MKRGLNRGKGDTMAIRGAGINDPENIRIVNLRDNEDKSWKEITNLLNEDRILKGYATGFTANNVHNRYNRNAPVLCAAEGIPFVPISERRKQRFQGGRSKGSDWNDHFDELLVQSHNDVKGLFWQQIADQFEETGGFRITASQAAYRMKLI